ncbi:MAG: hypothetical protein HRT57_14260 [Crocinitomicaceae bacterium]|nr:hypothetical protein [Crocinitomicaceae bacterium]
MKFVAATDSFPILNNFEDRIIVLNSPLDLQFIGLSIKSYQKSNNEAFNSSELNALFDRLESGGLDKRGSPKTIAKALLKVGKEEIKKPLYRAMLLMLIADYMSDRMESTDWVVKTEEDFQDAFGYNSHAYMGCFHMGTEYRNIFDVAMNDQNQILIRGEVCENPNLVSDALTKYLTINR